MARRFLAPAVGLIVLAHLGSTAARAELPFEGPPIHYLSAPVNDPVARLQTKLDRGEVTLRYDDRNGYLASVLKALEIPVSSQMLVFSKTSFQRTKISPETPRALYFNDDTYVGWVQDGDVVEISTVDPQQGAVFYLLYQEKGEAPKFQRQTHDCLQCHASSRTQDVPGHLVRSVFPDRSGNPVFNAGTFTTGHESPMSERWGGWYVTGRHGGQRHMGNVMVTDADHPEILNTEAGANVTDLAKLVDTGPYLSRHSDIVALMVLEHQTQMHNFLTLAHYQARLAMHSEAAINRALGKPVDTPSPGTTQRLRSPVEKLVKYLLFAEEEPLAGPVEGTSDFAREFAARGPRDRKGRSLRDLDLKTRLFTYPCSYLIYSEAFDALPDRVKALVSRRLREILTGEDLSPAYAKLSAEDRQAILEILLDTKPGLFADGTRP